MIVDLGQTADVGRTAVPVHLDGWIRTETLPRIAEMSPSRPRLAARFVMNRRTARAVIARETADALVDQASSVLAPAISHRVTVAPRRRPMNGGAHRQDQKVRVTTVFVDTLPTGDRRAVVPEHDAFDRIPDHQSCGDTSLARSRYGFLPLAETTLISMFPESYLE
jgi:hypothetical protein